MRKLINNIKQYEGHFTIGISSIIVSAYVFMHLNYLDDPRVTPKFTKIHDSFSAIDGITDDGWFATILMVVGLTMIFSILLNRKKVINLSFRIISALYATIGASFGIRGLLETHFNITWLFAFLSIALLVLVAKGSGQHFQKH
ncbi:hypothetical protein [Apilactobacillus timberlakei]|uniref:hypothetical protein n=1 Tax=Apilactobacillus timberlakei TaxID=2008380 RepID=UPI001128F5D8|nr:hypothetical protein [Apilactobacillus timberlakei]TPR12242.1 hypothetical protein DYZ97_07110 [Apilactobacillus timberlakei]